MLPHVRCELRAKCTKHWQELHFSHIGASARRHKNSKKSFRGLVRQCSMLRMHSNTAPRQSGSVLGPSRGRFWTALGRSWLARGAPRSALERFLGVQEPSRPRPDASPTRPRTPKTAQERFFVDFCRFFVDFRSIFRRFSLDFRTSSALLPLLSSAQFLRCCAARARRNG